MSNKHTLIVAFGQVHARAVAKSLNLGVAWTPVTTAEDLLFRTRHSFDLIFCETARQLPQYDEIVKVAAMRGWDIPTPLQEWGPHAATLSGAFRLLERLQGVDGREHYGIFCKGGQMGVYMSGVLVMYQREDGLLRYAKKGESLT